MVRLKFVLGMFFSSMLSIIAILLFVEFCLKTLIDTHAFVQCFLAVDVLLAAAFFWAFKHLYHLTHRTRELVLSEYGGSLSRR